MTNRGSALLLLVMGLGMFLPSSQDGTINYALVGTWQLACCGMLLGLLWLRSVVVMGKPLVVAMAIVCLLLLFTLTSPLDRWTLGASIGYVALLLVLCMDLRRLVPGRASLWMFAAACVAMQVLAWGLILGSEAVRDLISAHYQMYSDELFEQMVLWYAKPVATYATHSLASLAYFALCAICFRLAHFSRGARRAGWATMGAGFVGLQFYLLSNTSVVLLVALAALGVLYTVRTRSWLAFSVIVLAASFGISYLLVVGSDVLQPVLQIVSDILSSDNNGLRGRLSLDSRLGGSYQFILNHPLSAVGFTYSPKISLGDNFIAEYILRMTVLGYGLYVWMVYHFTTVNLGKRWGCWFFGFVVLADFAYPPLTAVRFILMVPALVVLWRSAPYLWPTPVRKTVMRYPAVSALGIPMRLGR